MYRLTTRTYNINLQLWHYKICYERPKYRVIIFCSFIRHFTCTGNKNILIFSRKNVPERDFRIQSDTLANDCFTRTTLIIIRFHKTPTRFVHNIIQIIIYYNVYNIAIKVLYSKPTIIRSIYDNIIQNGLNLH